MYERAAAMYALYFVPSVVHVLQVLAAAEVRAVLLTTSRYDFLPAGTRYATENLPVDAETVAVSIETHVVPDLRCTRTFWPEAGKTVPLNRTVDVEIAYAGVSA